MIWFTPQRSFGFTAKMSGWDRIRSSLWCTHSHSVHSSTCATIVRHDGWVSVGTSVSPRFCSLLCDSYLVACLKYFWIKVWWHIHICNVVKNNFIILKIYWSQLFILFSDQILATDVFLIASFFSLECHDGQNPSVCILFRLDSVAL